MARPRTPLLSPARIADAALALVDAGRPFGVNAIARELGVTPSSLYNHVTGRDEIVELMRGRLVDRYRLDRGDASWDEFLTQAVRLQRRMYGEHPFLIPLIVGQPITDRPTLLWYDQVAAALSEAGLPDAELTRAITLIDALAIGFGFDLAGPAEPWGDAEGARSLERATAAGPPGRERSDLAFEWGLDLLISSLHGRLAPASDTRDDSGTRDERPSA